MKSPVHLPFAYYSPGGRRQRGVVLYVALVIMVAMMLAGVALLRSVGAGQSVAGNLAFKQNATSAGDRGVNGAMNYLRPASAASVPSSVELAANQPTKGYFASWDPNFNPLTYPWDANTSAAGPVIEATPNDGTGNRVRYVVHRLCANAGALEGNNCISVTDGTTLNTGVSGASAGKIPDPPLPPYFRITTRIDGPRNTVSYTQVVMK